MKHNDDAIKQENKKAIPKFILMSVLGLVGGGILGFALAFFMDGSNFVESLTAAGASFTINVAPWLLIALPAVELIVCLPIYFGAKKQLAAWDGEDETVSNEIEARLSVDLWLTSMANVLDFFLAAALFSGFLDMEGNPMLSPVKFFGGLGAFLVTLYVTAVIQQKLVDATKRLNPEKQGSVYDTKVHKKWMESCDEAERAIIGQCALKAYQAVTITCLALWAVLGLGGMFFSWGFMPAMTVCIIWGVSQSVYSYWCLKLSKPGSPL